MVSPLVKGIWVFSAQRSQIGKKVILATLGVAKGITLLLFVNYFKGAFGFITIIYIQANLDINNAIQNLHKCFIFLVLVEWKPLTGLDSAVTTEGNVVYVFLKLVKPVKFLKRYKEKRTRNMLNFAIGIA